MVYSYSSIEASAVELSGSSQGYDHLGGTTARSALVTVNEQNRKLLSKG